MSQFQRLILNSKDRNNGEKISNINVYLREPITHATHCSVVSCELPNTFYSFKFSNYIFWYQTTDGITTTTRSALIDYERHYASAGELANYLSSLTVFQNDNISWSFSTATGKLTMNGTGNQFKPISWEEATSSSNYPNSAQMKLGFEKTVSFGTSHTANNIVNLLLTNNVYITSPLVAGETITTRPKVSNTLVKLPVNGNFGELINYTSEPSKDLLMVNNSHISHIRFELVDDEGEEIELNGLNWTLEIAFFYMRENKQNRLQASQPQLFLTQI